MNMEFILSQKGEAYEGKTVGLLSQRTVHLINYIEQKVQTGEKVS